MKLVPQVLKFEMLKYKAFLLKDKERRQRKETWYSVVVKATSILGPENPHVYSGLCHVTCEAQ